ncbi:GntR family transcriptional regulator [Panacibacter ginsenosidivorans]|uniref:GntR family transcriptional regulator n=1 Tax=Panacibacter ginsenosidivorans TaxID=1813871 RepID=A0A5B8VFE0_9BACT|nr:GntR family transcriptional regulator [Panacibacter ginsenosidivorans]QEC69823.1 GntR family transcriptional regulator [Panacibacter ginsenosidivorans]
MASENIYRLISIDEYAVTPKYVQLTNSIVKAIEEKKIEKGYLLPSINDLSFELDISRDTAEKAYKHLKKLGVIGSVPGKGYFISNTDVKQPIKIFLLFNKLSTHKKIMYDAFVASLGEDAVIDFYIYNNDFSLFRKLLTNKRDDYTNYVIIPHFLEGGENAYEIINTIPKEKLLLFDQMLAGVEGKFAAVYEDFEKDIYNALEQAVQQLSRYQTIRIIFPDYTYHPKQILEGFYRFCNQYAFNYDVVADINSTAINEGEVYISLMENDLVTLIERIIETKLEVGKQVGVISYNETPLKKIILNGITTISTDFYAMGAKAAELIRNKSTEHFAAPFYLTLRESL